MTINYTDFIANDGKRQAHFVADCIPSHGDISTVELMRVTGWTERQVRAAVKVAREDGIPIMSRTSSDGGYWLSNDPAEIERCKRMLVSKAASILRTAALLGNAQSEIDGQTSMPEVE
jgi:hypothetical protein